MTASHAFRLIVFDYDGTLVDSQRVILSTMAIAFTAHDLPAPSLEAVRRTVGLRLEAGVTQLLPDPGDGDLALRIAETYRQTFFRMRAQPNYDEPLFPGVASGLPYLNVPSVCLGIVTNKSRRGLMASLERHGIRGHFVTLQTVDDGPAKPHPELLIRAMADVGARPEETVVIGDTIFDMEMAGNANVPAIGVAWGYHGAAELRASGAARIVERFDNLPAILAGMREPASVPPGVGDSENRLGN